MAKSIIEGISILNSPPASNQVPKAPVVHLSNGLVLDDRIFESPTLLLGSVGSGKSVILKEILHCVYDYATRVKDNMVVFCAKKDLLRFAKSNDLIISVDSTNPKYAWNIFLELDASKNPELTARDIAKTLFKGQRSDLQPFFVNASQDIFVQSLLFMYHRSKATGQHYSNWEFIDFLEKTPMWQKTENDIPGWHELAERYPNYFGHVKDYLGNDLGQGFGVLSELRTLASETFFGSFCQKGGSFSAINALKTGNSRIFLYYDQANASEASLKIFQCILDLLFKHSVDEGNNHKTWFLIDEASLLPRSNALIDAMSYGRESGFRLVMALQSAQLMSRRYSESEAKSILSLFPNLISLRVQDSMSRELLSDRYGKALYAYSYTSVTQKILPAERERNVIADSDFYPLSKKGTAICSLPALGPYPFFYDGYRKELDQ